MALGGKNSSTGTVSPQISQEMESNESALVNIAQGQATNAQQLYNLTEPGLVQSEDFYSKLASGDPAAIMQAIAPAAQQTAQAASGAKANIEANSPAGGEKNLALENVDVSRGAQIASSASGATLSAPNALGQIAGQGINAGISSAGQATGALNSANTDVGNLQSLTFQGQQLQMEQKGQTLGALGGLAGDATQLGTAGMGAGASKGMSDAMMAIAA
jgi:hypothetical protein